MDDGCIVAAREERLLDIWCRKLQAELLEMEAPIIGTLRVWIQIVRRYCSCGRRAPLP